MLSRMDDRRVGLVLRALRRRRRWRQQDVAVAAGVSQSSVSRAERGHLDSLSLRTLRQMLRAVDARADVDVRWRGGEADRLVDARHAEISGKVARTLARAGWQVYPEVTFQQFGERGSIDLLAADAASRAVLIVEVKSAIHSYEETQRRLDVKRRLASSIALERLGWRPAVVGVVLVVEDTTANRRRLASVAPLVEAALPARTIGIRRWLRQPEGVLLGLWFVRLSHAGTGMRRFGGSDRVRVPSRRRPASRPSVGPRD
jgi:transcriptional regulator with XRE-family HTH domain